MVPTQISCFFSQWVFRQVFSGLRSNRISIVSGCSDPLSLSSLVFAFFTRKSLAYQTKRSMVRYVCILPVLSACLWGFVVQICGHPSQTGIICLSMGFCGPKLWTPQPNWRDMFVHGVLWSKVVDTPA